MVDDIKTKEGNTIDNPPNFLATEVQSGDDPADSPLGAPNEDPKPKKQKRRLSKKQKLIMGIVAIVFLGGLSTYFIFFKKEAPVAQPVQQSEQPPAPTTVASRLTGLQVDPEVNERVVTGIMIENSPDARPQSGLRQADVVFEAVAEGGITRFLALFYDSQPSYIGPVRSARPYYLDFLVPHDAPIAHAGGSAKALAQIRSQKIKDLEAFQNPKYYQRVSSRYAPHNLYTSIEKLNKLEESKGWKTSKFTGFARNEKGNPSTEPTARTINLSISGALYNVRYTYNSKENNYKRFLAGKAHTDEKSGKQITADVVVVLVMKKGSDGYYTTYKTTGSGPMYVFQDGVRISGTWSKKDRKSQFEFKAEDGQILKLNPGKTWVTLVGQKSDVSKSAK